MDSFYLLRLPTRFQELSINLNVISRFVAAPMAKLKSYMTFCDSWVHFWLFNLRAGYFHMILRYIIIAYYTFYLRDRTRARGTGSTCNHDGVELRFYLVYAFKLHIFTTYTRTRVIKILSNHNDVLRVLCSWRALITTNAQTAF